MVNKKTEIKNKDNSLNLEFNIDNLKQDFNFIKSPLNYVGGKFKLLPQLMDIFSNLNKTLNIKDKQYSFCDVFGGGMNVAINIQNYYQNQHLNLFNEVIYNDANKHIVNLFKEMLLNKDFLTEVRTLLKQYGLLFENNPSSSHDLKLLKQKFLQLRQDFNDLKLNNKDFLNQNNINSKSFNVNQFNLNVYFYALICCGFNNNIRFNSKGEYNIAYGERTLNGTMENHLILFLEKLRQYFTEDKMFNLDYYDFVQLQLNRLNYDNINGLSLKEDKEDKDFKDLNLFFYFDPPYLISSANYGNILWKDDDEKRLLMVLEELIHKDIKFALSNVIEHKGMKNELLIDFINKHQLNIININKHYNNASSLAYKAKGNHTQEVVVINY